MREAGEAPLPSIRPELRLLEGAPTVLGQPTWLIQDPLQNRFVQIDAATYETLSLWNQCRTRGELVEHVNARGRAHIDHKSLEALIAFLTNNKLTDVGAGGWRRLAEQRSSAKRSALSWLLHNYLFFRIPLWQPQRFLERTLPFVRLLASRPARLAFLLLGLLGIYLVSRELDTYLATLQSFVTWEGMLLAAVAIVLVKAAHELGHAYTAVALGCRVPTIGIAFMLLAPLLYTDVTDAWRLRRRRHRLMIDSAGIRVELYIAALALFLWAFLPDGTARSLAFMLSAVSLASSLVINLNPFMRFDGYYLLSELLGIENLQPRAFALGRWRLREALFGLGRPCPEELPRGLVRALVAYAYATWIYRLALFLGIALVVYHYFFKALGIVLFLAEIAYFVARPVASELSEWVKLRGEILVRPRTAITVLASLGLVALLVVPWSTGVEIPAVVEAAQLQPVHAPRPARVTALHVAQGASVETGDPIVSLASPDIDNELRLSHTRLRLIRLQLARRGADSIDREASLVLENELAALISRIEGLERERAELVLRAPFSGRIAELEPHLAPGRWVGPGEPLAVVVGGHGLIARGYVAEQDMWRIVPGSKGRFVPDHAQRPALPVAVSAVAASAAAGIEIADLAGTFGGKVAVSGDPASGLVPVNAQFMVQMATVGEVPEYELAARGVAVVEGRAESLVARAWRQTLKVLLRESGA